MVVLETLFWIGCKSAKMFIVGFCGVSCCCGKHNSTTKAHSNQTILAKVLILGSFFTVNIALIAAAVVLKPKPVSIDLSKRA